MLKEFIRPTDDNGRSIHFGLDIRQDKLDYNLPLLRDLGMRWCVFFTGDELQAKVCAMGARKFEIMPILRPKCKIDGGQPNWETYVQNVLSVCPAAYIVIYNEPSDQREWNGKPNHQVYVNRWRDAASRVVKAGGYAGLQTLDQQDVKDCLSGLDVSVLGKAFFASHSYASNHPPDYPYDPVNQKDHPGASIFDDDTCQLRFIEEAEWVKQAAGDYLPVLVTEGGYLYQQSEDDRYPRTDDVLHAQYNAAIFNQFRGRLANGQPLPDYLFCYSPWIWSDPDWDSWYLGVLGTRQQTIDAVKAIPPFVRKFSWDSPPTLEQAVVEAAKKQTWMPLNDQAALYKFAQANSLGQAQTDEWEFAYGLDIYIGQVFERGIAYVKKGDWANCRWVKEP